MRPDSYDGPRDFLTRAVCEGLVRWAEQQPLGAERLHRLPGMSDSAAARLYSPSGRSEFPLLDDLLLEASSQVERTLERMLRSSALAVRDLTIVRYAVGQEIVSHFDCLDRRPCGCNKVAGISIALQRANDGGVLFVDKLLDQLSMARLLSLSETAPGEYADAFRQLHRRRILLESRVGQGCAFGPLCAHGVTRVDRGASWRLVGFVFRRCEGDRPTRCAL